MTDNTDETEIRKLIEGWAAAVRSKDMEGILRVHAPDILMFDLPPPLESRGREAYQATWDLFFRWSRRPVVFDIQRLEIRAGSEVAFAMALMRCAGTERNGAEIDLDFRLTVGLCKVGGRWTIVHEHHSIPAES